MTALHNQFPRRTSTSPSARAASRRTRPTRSPTRSSWTPAPGIGVTRNWAKSVVNWNLALDPRGGPHTGGCGTCTGVLTIAPTARSPANAEYYTLGHLTRFVQPGAVRIASTSFGTTGWNGQIMDVAFRNPDGSTVLVAHNENDNPQSFSVREGGRSFDYTLPGGALATFVWNGRIALGPAAARPDRLDRDRRTRPARPTLAAPAMCGERDRRRRLSTRYSSGTGPDAGPVPAGRPRPASALRQVVFDTGASTGDYPRGYAVTAPTASTGRPRSRTESVTGQFATADLRGGPIRYVRITLTTAAPDNWWSVADVRAYRHR